ncbi:MAG: DNA topoisomerase (ATP-hydrolyzing) [Clostridia bacterium]
MKIEELQENHQPYILKSIDEVLHDSMIPYTEHVVMERALPRVEDGLKPGQRRILYSMLELGLGNDKAYRKSARIVGDCLGKYHPHGDTSVYEAMVRMAQPFSLKEPLVDGQGNFGSVDGDTAAAMRYTEAKLTPLAMELLRDLDCDTVPWSLNFDDTLKEPDILPGRFPNLLVNGASGIAVGLATNIPTHNLSETINGVVAFIDNPHITIDQMMKFIPAPDFPTGGIIIAGNELKDAYTTGKGKIIIRARVSIEKNGDKQNIIISELPYQVNKALLLQKIAELKEENKDKLTGIAEIRDESDRKGMRAIIKIKKECNAEAILEYLFKATNMQVSFGINMVAIAGGKPKQMGLLDIIEYYVEYQRCVVLRRSKFLLDKAKDRAHIIEGLLIAIHNIDEVVKTIKKSESYNDAKAKLRAKFSLSEKQAQAILDMRLARLVNLETTKLEEEMIELTQQIKKLSEIVNSKKMQYETVKTELLEIKKKYGMPRLSTLVISDGVANLPEIKEEEVFAKEVYVALTMAGTIKKIPQKNYLMSQKEITDATTSNEIHTQLILVKTNEKVLIFTNLGNCIKIEVDEIPEARWKDKGKELKSLDRGISAEEVGVAIFKENQEFCDKFVFFTKLGMIKLSESSEYCVNKSVFQAIKIKPEDELLDVQNFTPEGGVLMVSKSGMALNFEKTNIPIQNRISGGVMGINLESDDTVIYASQTDNGGAITVATDYGYIKKIPIGEYPVSARYRKGLKMFNLKNNGTKLVFASYGSYKPIVGWNGSKFVCIDECDIMYDDRGGNGTQLFGSPISSATMFFN